MELYDYDEKEIMTTPEIRVATERMQCNAWLHMEGCLSEVAEHCTFTQKRALVKARENNGYIEPGDKYVFYIWNPGGSEECECCEIPELREICCEQDLWCN